MQYSLSFRVTPDLPDHSQSYLPEHIHFCSPNKLVICLHQEQNETNEAFKSRAEWRMKRELLRIYVLEGTFFDSTYLSSEPPLSFGFTGTPSTGWFQRPLNPDLAKDQESWEPNIELKLLLWEKAQRKISDVRLTYAYLNMFCENHYQNNTWNKWNYQNNETLTPFHEINMLRNLLLHNGNTPNDSIQEYLRRYGIPYERNIENSQRHIKLANDRLHVVLPAVWMILLNDLGFGDLNS